MLASPAITVGRAALLIAGALAAAFPHPVEAAKKWRVYETCILVDNPANDGDSFHVKWVKPGFARTYLFRLYWVDTPESDNSLPDRVKEQAAYWGITEAEVVKLGKEATRFTERFLKNGFSVHSKLEDARGRSAKDRDYGIAMVGDKDLAIELVANGLARIHGFQELPPEFPSLKIYQMRMRAAEAQAKQQRLGAWALTGQATRSPFQAPPTPVAAPTPGAAAGAPASPVPAAPSPAPLATPAPAGEIMEQDITLERSLAVFSLRDNSFVGTLQAGHRVTVLRAESPAMARIRFRVSDDRVLEGQCRRADLGL
jgi:endonuclease YncB( thermonuclease family)